ncbi:hypothetical protein I4F81_007529 [Pyropia yezoensis]|uniref:Uncharacterized protein n=1 Tax=Pyropia yezoensis TaxID=2788 RepID=A0ACC3C5D5_PYRYE|nr:hypothetical protein I4F81_007529 [Neopyropia yezoensis]
MPRRGSSRRKRRTHVAQGGGGASGEAELAKQPRSLVVRRGKVPAPLRDLVTDIRTMLLPATAERLRERRRNTLRDYTAVAPTLGLSHLWLVSATEAGSYLKIAGVPAGPTATFRIDAYSLAKDVRGFQRRPVSLSPADVRSPPLLVLNNWGAAAAADKKVALVAELFRHTVPPLDVRTVVLSDVRRVVLVDREDASGAIHLRQYALRVARAGLSRAVRKMIAVRGVRRGARSSVKLVEIGPRLRLSLVKVEAGVCDGEVLYHAHVVKSAAEAAATADRLVEREETRKRRREEQEGNVARKADAKRAKRERRHAAAAARAAGQGGAAAADEDGASSVESGSDGGAESDSDGEGGWVSDDGEEGEGSDDGGRDSPNDGRLHATTHCFRFRPPLFS